MSKQIEYIKFLGKSMFGNVEFWLHMKNVAREEGAQEAFGFWCGAIATRKYTNRAGLLGYTLGLLIGIAIGLVL